MGRLKSSRMAAFAFASAVALVVVVAISLVAASGARAQNDQSTWVPAPGVIPAYDDITGIYMTGENGAWLSIKENNTGAVSYIEWQGDHWVSTYRTPGFRCPLRDVSAVSNQNVWAVGDCGLIMHGTQGGWAEVSNPVPNANLYTIQMLGDGSEGWAGGYLPNTQNESLPIPVLLHYVNGRWNQDTSITSTGRVLSLHFAQDGGWATVGSDIWHYQGGKWSKETLPSPCEAPGCFVDLNGIRAISGQEAWAVGDVVSTCGICVPHPYVLVGNGGSWQNGLPSTSSPWLDLDPQDAYYLNAVYFTDPAYGLLVGGRIAHATNPQDQHQPLVLSVINGAIVDERAPALEGDLLAVAASEPGHALAVGTNGLILSNGYGFAHAPGPIPTYPQPFYTPTATPTPLPSLPIPDPHNPSVTYFSLVGHTLRGGFRDYWNAHGGLEQFGYPITEEFQEASPTDGKMYDVQYFERARFEWHPENHPPYDVLLGLLGRTVTAGREKEEPFQAAPAKKSPGFVYFPATQHNMTPQFVQYWQDHGGLPVYGYPISEAFTEVSKADGKSYLVQYFERNRLEYHPELPQAFQVSLGLLGTEVLKARGWIQ